MERKREKNVEKQKLHSQKTGPWIILESALQNTKLCLFTETKWQMLHGIPDFYLTSGAVDYMAVIFCAHLVAVKCEVFTTTSTREIQLCPRPATQLTCSPLLLADFTHQSIAHAQKSKWKGSVDNYFALLICCHLCKVCICFILQIINVKQWWRMCWNYIFYLKVTGLYLWGIGLIGV